MLKNIAQTFIKHEFEKVQKRLDGSQNVLVQMCLKCMDSLSSRFTLFKPI